ncbi:transglycosylase domain-containing protein, partial [Burkholderia humptydooensis]
MPIIKRPPSSRATNEHHYSLRRSPAGAYYTDDDDDGDRASRRTSRDSGSRTFGSRVALWFVGLFATLLVVGALIVGYALVVMGPQLPSLDALTHYQPKVPLRVYSADHVLLGEFGEERRSLVRFADIPDVMKKAVLAIEDYRFYEHGGVDFVGILRAGVA